MGPGTIGFIIVNIIIVPALLLVVLAFVIKMIAEFWKEARAEALAEYLEESRNAEIISMLPAYPADVAVSTTEQLRAA